MRSKRSSPVVPTATEGAMTMAQMMEIMRALQANVEASRIEQAKMHEDLVASQARNEELSKVTEELRQALQEQRGHTVVEEVAPSSKLASSIKGGRQRTVIQETLKTPRAFVADHQVLQISKSTKKAARSHRSLT